MRVTPSFFMAIELSRKVKKFVDISLSFEPNPLTGDLSTITNERAINNSIKNLILISPNEVPFNRNVGSTVAYLMFDMCDEPTAGLIRDEIQRTISYNEPRVTTEEIFVKAEPESNQFVVTVKYKIIGYDQIFTTTQILTPTR